MWESHVVQSLYMLTCFYGQISRPLPSTKALPTHIDAYSGKRKCQMLGGLVPSLAMSPFTCAEAQKYVWICLEKHVCFPGDACTGVIACLIANPS